MPTSSIDWPAVRAAAAFRLAMPRTPIGGRVGERLGSGTGSSLEFQDYRPYAPGDDLRHVDWAAYARSELLAVRLYREEVAPRIDLVLDISRSMAVTEQKLRAYGELAGAAGVRLRVDRRRLAHHHDVGRPTAALARAGGHRALPRLRRQRSPRSKRPTCRSGAARCASSSATSCFRTTPTRSSRGSRATARCWRSCSSRLREEAEPVVEGGRRLVDVEGRGELDLVIDEAAVRDYRARFSRLRLGLSRAARRVGARFAHVVAGTPVREVARGLAAAGVLEAA